MNSTSHAEPPRLLLVREVAEILRVSDETVYRMINGTAKKPPVLDSLRVMGSVRVLKDSLDLFVKNNVTRAGSGEVPESIRIKMGMPPKPGRR
jgi:hypothetical protein